MDRPTKIAFGEMREMGVRESWRTEDYR